MKIPYPHLCNIYSDEIADDVFIGPFCEIQKGVKIGAGSRIQSHTFICEGVTIGQNCFIGHGVMFVNDLYPKIGQVWIVSKTTIEDNVSIGSNATILPVRIGKGSLIGAGSVVVKDIKPGSIVKGNPAK